MTHITLISIAVIPFLFFLRFLWVMARIFRRPKAPLLQYPLPAKGVPRPHRVLCLGDSITQGDLGENYVNILRGRFDPETVVFANGGVNGDLAETLWRRMDDAIAFRPDVVTLLIGTNNLNAGMSESNTRSYIRQGKITKASSPASYMEHVGLILGRIQGELGCPVAVFSIPLISTDLGHPVNLAGDSHNQILRELCLQHGASWLSLRETQTAFLKENSGTQNVPYEKTNALMFRAFVLRALGFSWDRMSVSVGNPFSFDHLHSTTLTAGMIARLAEGFVRDALARKTPSVQDASQA